MTAEQPNGAKIERLQQRQAELTDMVVESGGYDSKHPDLWPIAMQKKAIRNKLARMHSQSNRYYKHLRHEDEN